MLNTIGYLLDGCTRTQPLYQGSWLEMLDIANNEQLNDLILPIHAVNVKALHAHPEMNARTKMSTLTDSWNELLT